MPAHDAPPIRASGRLRERAAPRRWTGRLLLAACLLATTACLNSTRPAVKLGLVAPFEGRYAEIGQQVIWAVRLAVREANARGGVAGYSVELTALDDRGDPEQAQAQARKLAADPAILGVIGHWREASTAAALPVYAAAGLPVLVTAGTPVLGPGAYRLWPTRPEQAARTGPAHFCPPPCDSLEDLNWLAETKDQGSLAGPPLWGLAQFAQLAGPSAEAVAVALPAPLPGDSADPDFARRYRAAALTPVEPGAYAVLAYDAANLLLDALARSALPPTPARLAAALASANLPGLSGPLAFDASGERKENAAWRYEWRGGVLVRNP